MQPDCSATHRFTGLADLYARHRPDYPAAALDYIGARCDLGPGSVLVDVGCGTGISARLFAARGVTVVGVEPNDDMRRQAERERQVENLPHVPPRYVAGTAEATGLPDAAADAVLAAQAFHWFRPEEALREFHRLLRPGGWVALMWNERDPSDLFTAAYGQILRHDDAARAVEASRASAGAVLLTSPRFEAGERVHFRHEQSLDEEGLVGRALSASYAPRQPDARAAFVTALRALFTRGQRDGRARLCYQTTVYSARRAGG